MKKKKNVEEAKKAKSLLEERILELNKILGIERDKYTLKFTGITLELNKELLENLLMDCPEIKK